jgi:hypothetical protein
LSVEWHVGFHPQFAIKFAELAEPVQDELAALIEVLKMFGPHLKRPGSDTLGGSSHSNMKELRFEAGDGVWCVAYAFDPLREAILLVAGDKSGVSQKRFYRVLIAKADERFDEHLADMAKTEKKK